MADDTGLGGPEGVDQPVDVCHELGYDALRMIDKLPSEPATEEPTVERYARAHGLSEWEMKSVALRESPLPHSRRVIETPPQVSRGLRELEAALT